MKLTLQWVTQAQFAGYYAALDKGYYEEEGIDLDHPARAAPTSTRSS